MRKFIIKTHGCKSNQLESTVIKEKLIDAGFLECKTPEEADIFILNSCSVTENADNEALRTVRNAKNKNEKLITVLTGCSAQLHAHELLELPYIDMVLGNDDKFNIVPLLNAKQSQITDIFEIGEFNNQIIHDYSNTRGYLKIQDGCNNYCSYCTIPLARGKSRSNDVENIIDQIKIYTDIGIKEVVLTGIHIGQWGTDFKDKKSLLNLLEQIENTDIKRYRLGSLNTLEINDVLLEFLGQSEKFCPHFHLSLQSLTDKTLTAMNRHYTAQSCLDLMEKIDETFTLPFLGSDIIVGFPGESDTDFETTVQNVIKSKLSNIHVFPYSVRSNTKAAAMSGHIEESKKHERADILHKIAKQKFETFIQKNINRTQQVLIEKRPDKKTGLLKGVTKNYLNVLIDAKDKILHNTVQNVKITAVDKDSSALCAELLTNRAL